MTDEKDMKRLRRLPKFSKVVKDKAGVLWDYEHDRQVDIRWGWNDDASLDQMIQLRFKDKEGKYHDVVLDYQEVVHFGRATTTSLKEVEARLAAEAQARL